MPTYPMAQGDLYLLLPLVWGLYTDHQPAFGKYKKARYTPTLGAEELAKLDTAMKLPNDQAREGVPEATRIELQQQLAEWLDAWNLLDGYVEDAFRPAGTYKAQREAAGGKLYEKAAEEDWGAAQEMINTALAYVAANAQVLKEAGGMDDDFANTLNAEGEDVRRVLRRMLRERKKAEEGTSAKITANEALYSAFQQMSADAQRLFRRDLNLKAQFQQETLLAQVRGTRQAGIRGVVTDAAGQELAGVAVTVPGVEKATAVTDADGRYFIGLPAGTYTVAVGQKEISGVVVSVGVKKRVDVEV